MVVVWINPHPGSDYLSSVARFGECQRWSDVEGWWPDNWESEQSVVAINVCCPRWLSQILGFLVASLHPTRHLPLRSGRCSCLRGVTACGEQLVWMPTRLETVWPLAQIFMVVPLWLSSHLAPISSVPVRLNANIQESTYTRLAWNDPHWLGLCGIKISFFLA